MSRSRIGFGLLALSMLIGCDLFNGEEEHLSPGHPIPGTERDVVDNDGFEVLEFGSNARFSPDGTSLAYHTAFSESGESGIYLKEVGSSSEQFLVKGYRPDWSPDGKWIVFFSGGHNLGKVSPVTRELIQLTFGGESLEPAWSPDGKLIAFYSSDGDPGTSIATITNSGADLTRIFAGGQPDWFPDGRILSSLGSINAFLIYDPNTPPPDTTLGIPDGARGFQVSPDGKRIVFWNTSGIWLCGSDGGGLRKIVRSDYEEVTPDGNPRILSRDPSWHPDGRHIMFDHLLITSIRRSDVTWHFYGKYSLRLLDVGEP